MRGLREPGQNHLTGKTTMLNTDTRCQQVNAGCCPPVGCVSGEKMQRMLCLRTQRDQGSIAFGPVTRHYLSSLLWILQHAALQISLVKLQKCFSVN